MKTKEFNRAIILRRKGLMYSEIAQELNISKSTARTWTKDVALSSFEFQRLSDRYKKNLSNNVNKMAISNVYKRTENEKNIQQNAELVIKNLSININNKRLLCAFLFWCEGEKSVNSGIRFINSDPEMIKTFLKLFRESFYIDESKFRALVHLHNYHDPVLQLEYWSKITKIPLSQFNKSFIKKNTGKQKREGYPGCISIRYGSSDLGKLLKMIYIEFSNKF